MKKIILLVFLFLISCTSSNYKDGNYQALSVKDEDGSYSKIVLSIKDNKIVKADFIGYDKNNKEKDIDYGKQTNNKEFYQKAQRAVSAIKEYPKRLLEVQDIDKVDAISGATISYNQFLQAVDEALRLAKK